MTGYDSIVTLENQIPICLIAQVVLYGCVDPYKIPSLCL